MRLTNKRGRESTHLEPLIWDRTSKCTVIHLPNRDELLLRIVFALPNASRMGFTFNTLSSSLMTGLPPAAATDSSVEMPFSACIQHTMWTQKRRRSGIRGLRMGSASTNRSTHRLTPCGLYEELQALFGCLCFPRT